MGRLLADAVALRLGRLHQNVNGVPLADEFEIEEEPRAVATRVGR